MALKYLHRVIYLHHPGANDIQLATDQFLPLDEAIASRAETILVSGSDGWLGRDASGHRKITINKKPTNWWGCKTPHHYNSTQSV